MAKQNGMMALPKTIYVKEIRDSDGKQMLDASSTLFDIVEDELTVVGVYELVKQEKVRKIVEIK